MAVDLLNIAKSGLNSSRSNMNVTTHNIANANTEGFSRQRALQAANTPLGMGPLIFGTGSTTKNVQRLNDTFIEKNLNNTISEFNFHKERTELLTKIEDMLNEINTGQLNKSINDFFNSFRILSNNPENDTMRTIIRENARQLIKDFRDTKELMKDLNNYINRNVDQMTYDINTILAAVTKLNIKIDQLEAQHGETGDLRDERDNYLRELASMLAINTYTNERGRYIVDTYKMGTLISADKYSTMYSGSPSSVNAKSYQLPLNDIFLKGRGSMGFGKYVQGGKLGAIFNVRLNELKEVDQKLDLIAFNLVKAVNAIHNKGFSNTTLAGPGIDNGKYTNINFFQDLESVDGSSELIALSDEIQQDTNNIAVAAVPNSPGDNKIALSMANLQYERFLDDGKSTIEEEYLKLIAKIGLDRGRSQINLEQSEGILTQNKTIKERVSGVSIDEEAANMSKYQQSFNASARMVQVAEEMMDTVLSLKR